MKPFELAYLCAEPGTLPLYRIVRRELLRLTDVRNGSRALLLDVGGRKSHYTVGVPAWVSITELLRRTHDQLRLNLGADHKLVRQTLARRSNVAGYAIDDMTRSSVRNGAFDIVTAVEVIEHVEADETFVAEIHRVLKPGGWFLATTPNGDSKPIPSGDHRRHYRREQLDRLLAKYFPEVEVWYAVPAGRARTLGLRSWSVRHPIRALTTLTANVVNGIQAARPSVRDQAKGTRHLIALARKALLPS